MPFVTTKQFIDSCIRRNDEAPEKYRSPLADVAQCNSGISSSAVNKSTNIIIYLVSSKLTFFSLSPFIRVKKIVSAFHLLTLKYTFPKT